MQANKNNNPNNNNDNEYWGYRATFFSKVLKVTIITSNKSYVLINFRQSC